MPSQCAWKGAAGAAAVRLFIPILLSAAIVSGQQPSPAQLAKAGWDALSVGRLNQAATAFDDALKLAPQQTTLLLGAGVTAHLQGRSEAARRYLIDALRIEGNEGVSDTTIVRLLGLRRGQLYKRTDMTAAQRRVYESEIFRQTLVQVDETTDSAKTVVL